MSPVRMSPLCVLLLAAACNGSSYGSSASHAPAPAASPAASSAASSAASAAPLVVAGQQVNTGGTFDATHHPVVAVQAQDFRFSPSVIVGTPGEVLTLEIANTSQTKHNVTQKAQRVDADLAPGAHATVRMTVPASGQLVFTCEYHASAGMAGTVQAPGAKTMPAMPATAAPTAGSGYAPYGS